jgi:hypothetical protein
VSEFQVTSDQRTWLDFFRAVDVRMKPVGTDADSERKRLIDLVGRIMTTAVTSDDELEGLVAESEAAVPHPEHWD